MKIIDTTTRVITTVTKTTTHLTDNNILITEKQIDNKNTSITFEDFESNDEHYQPVFMRKPTLKYLKEEYRDFYKFIEKFRFEPKDINKLEEKYLYFVSHYDHSLKDYNRQYISLPVRFDYIGSLRQKIPRDPIYEKLIKLLKKHPYILQLEEHSIPGYNSDFFSQKGIKIASAYVPQEHYTKLIKQYDKENAPSYELNKDISMNYQTARRDIDVYGEEITKLVKEFHEQEEYYDSGL